MNDDLTFQYNFTCIECGACDYPTPEESAILYCKSCGHQYPGGYKELMQLHEPKIRAFIGDKASEKTKDQIILGMYAKLKEQIGDN